MEFPIFDSLSFLLEFMFLFNKKDGVLVYNSFQNENNRKTTHGFAPRSLIFKLQQVVLKFKIFALVGAPQTLTLRRNF